MARHCGTTLAPRRAGDPRGRFAGRARLDGDLIFSILATVPAIVGVALMR